MQTINKDTKLLVLDIEWKPTKAYVWQAWDQNITPDKIIEHGGLLCVAAKWLGKPEKYFWSEWEHGKPDMLKGIHALLEEADGVITYNGDRYDIPKLNGEFLLAHMPPPPTPTSIDVIKAVKKLGLFMNRLAFVGPLFNVGAKLKHQGFDMWVNVEKGDERARRLMKRYNIQDVVLLERLYLRVRPYIRNHPHMGNTKARSCGSCGKATLQSRGYRRTKAYRIQRIQCTTCGSWQDGARTKT